MSQLIPGCALAALALLAPPLFAQAAGAQPINGVLSTNVLGVLQLGPNLEYERATGDGSAVGVGLRLPSLGLMSHVIDDGIQGGWSIYGVWHIYPNTNRLRGWYLGPHVELGKTDNKTYSSDLFGAGGEFGYRWVRPSGFSMVLGGLLGILKSDDTWKDGTGSAGHETYALWMLNVSLGVAR